MLVSYVLFLLIKFSYALFHKKKNLILLTFIIIDEEDINLKLYKFV